MSKIFHTYISREQWDAYDEFLDEIFIQKSLKEEYAIDHILLKTVVEYDLDMVSITSIWESVDD